MYRFKTKRIKQTTRKNKISKKKLAKKQISRKRDSLQNETLETNYLQNYQPFQQEPVPLNKGGIFCYMPYDAVDNFEKSIFKIDSNEDIENKIQDLQKYYPSGFFVIAILRLKEKSKRFYEKIKKNIITELIKKGGKVQINFEDGWIYCLENSIHDVFNQISKEKEGKVTLYYLSGRNKDNFKMMDKQITKVPTFTGKVVYHT